MGASTKAAEGGKNKYKRKETPSSSSPKDKYNKDKKKHKIDVESTIKNPNNSNYEESDLSNSALKRQAKKERQSQRRHADVVTEAKLLWNKIRIKSNTPEQTSELMNEIMSLIKGKVTEIALQHDASRVVQAAIQFGTDEQRYDILKEICENDTAARTSTSTTNANTSQLVELSKIQYAHFVCLKFIKYCHRNPDCVKLIVKSFKGSIPKLAVHSVGARVVESIFLNFPQSSTSQLKHEFFGPHFNLFSTTITESNNTRTTLKTVIDSAKTDTQKESALQFVKEIITKGTTKQFFGYNYFQEILSEYLDYLAAEDPNEIRNSSIVSSLVDHSIHLLSTRSGAKVVALCASYGTPKDRKRICKSLKGFTRSTLLHRDAYLALLKLIQVTDDTVSIHKSVFNEILTSSSKSNEGGRDGDDNNNESPFLELALSETASKLFILLLVEEEEKRNKYFDPYEQSVLCHDAYFTENGKKIPTSKKDTAIRRKELLNYLNTGLSNACIQHADQLLTSLPGSRIIKEVYDNDAAASKEKQQEIVKAIVDACEAGLVLAKKGDDSDGDHGDGSNTNFALFEDPTGHRSVKNLFLCDATKEEPTFTMEFMDRLGDQLLEVAKSNRGAFVVTALMKVPKVKKQVKKQLSTHKKELKKSMSSKGGATSGYEALLTELSSSK